MKSVGAGVCSKCENAQNNAKYAHSSKIRPLLTKKVAQVLVQSLVISRLDYCNSLLAGLPASAIRPLQLS